MKWANSLLEMCNESGNSLKGGGGGDSPWEFHVLTSEIEKDLIATFARFSFLKLDRTVFLKSRIQFLQWSVSDSCKEQDLLPELG